MKQKQVRIWVRVRLNLPEEYNDFFPNRIPNPTSLQVRHKIIIMNE